MNIVVCLDDGNTMAFNQRRQSMDAQLRHHMLQLLCGETLWMHPYSAKQFADTQDICVDPDYLDKAQDNDWCFVELQSLDAFQNQIHKMLIYRWNRRYPGDLVFPEGLLLRAGCPVQCGEFSGSSHERISWEVYEL